jgi:hypothetical protein
MEMFSKRNTENMLKPCNSKPVLRRTTNDVNKQSQNTIKLASFSELTSKI